MIAYHGILTQRANFEDLLAQVQTFLTTPESSRETVIMSIQQGAFSPSLPPRLPIESEERELTNSWGAFRTRTENASTPLFLALLRSYISLSPSLWFLANRIPRLAEVRGKIVLFSRFGTAADEREWEAMGGMGIHPEGWRDSVREGFEVDLPRGENEGMSWTLGIQDWCVASRFSWLSKPALSPPCPPTPLPSSPSSPWSLPSPFPDGTTDPNCVCLSKQV